MMFGMTVLVARWLAAALCVLPGILFMIGVAVIENSGKSARKKKDKRDRASLKQCNRRT